MAETPEDARFPGYDVLAKRNTPSWNQQTRQVVDRRLAIARDPRFFEPAAWRALIALCDRIVPQPDGRPRVPIEALVDDKLAGDKRDGFRNAAMPPQREAWARGLAALDAEAEAGFGAVFADLPSQQQDTLLRAIEAGDAHHPAWGDMSAKTFFQSRVLADIVAAYYAFPAAWNEIGFGGPASPRGYVRMDFDRRDPWEAAEAKPARLPTRRA